MPLMPNALRRKISAGGTAAGAALASFSPEVMDIAGLAGLDFVRIDHEHAFRRDAGTEVLVRAALARGVAAVVRVDRAELALVPKLLEIGAAGVIVAGVRGVAEAREAVRAARFPPLGDRGFAATNLSNEWGTADAGEWIAWSNREPLLGVTIENPEAVADAEAIVAEPGLDFVQFGWADFSIASGLGRPVKFHPDVAVARRHVFGATRGAGKHIMMGVESSAAAVAEARALGVSMLEFGRDLAALLAAWKGVAALAAGAAQEG